MPPREVFIDKIPSTYFRFDYSELSTNVIRVPHIKKVIFNNPATIVFWADNTKTVVKCDPSETFDPEKGLAMAISKKALGNRGNYFNEIKKWTESYHKEFWDKKLTEINKCIDMTKKLLGVD